MSRVAWPDGKRFAFTIFDDPDAQRLDAGRLAYDCLADLGFRTTKGVWPILGDRAPTDNGLTCDVPAYRDWCLELQARGFEIGYHNATQYTSERAVTARGIERFAELFGHDPATMSNHYNCDEGIYFGDRRLSGARRSLYNVLTRGRNRDAFHGHTEGHPLFWGDLCRDRVTYVRNFVFGTIDTLAACPQMPYHDPQRPFVRQWYASSEGSDAPRFVAMISEANQDRLAEQGGACIMYTHFGHGYVRDGRLDPRFVRLMTRLAGLGGWYVPVRELLDHLRGERGEHVLTDAERTRLEWRWLAHKVRYGMA